MTSRKVLNNRTNICYLVKVLFLLLSEFVVPVFSLPLCNTIDMIQCLSESNFFFIFCVYESGTSYFSTYISKQKKRKSHSDVPAADA